MYEAPPVLNLNLRGLFSSTDLMSLAAAGAEPAIVNLVWDGGGDEVGMTAKLVMYWVWKNTDV